MSERLETQKYTLTVEGETEKWYFDWLGDQINSYTDRKYNVSINAVVEQRPAKFYKSLKKKTTPTVYHVCDVESKEQVHVEKFQNILSQMKDAKTQKDIYYVLGYSNYAFELWMVLHKRNCNGPLSHRSKYLDPICQAFGERFEDLDHYKQEKAFKRCLSKLTIEDVKAAIGRANVITMNNEKDGKKQVRYKGYSYYTENPALSVHEIVNTIFIECGLISK